MIQFDETKHTSIPVRHGHPEVATESQSGFGRLPFGSAADKEAGPEDAIPYVSPPPAPFPRVLPGL